MVSIILPNFNHERYLQHRLDSIFKQTYQDFEVIILDDASTDASVNLLQKYKSHPKVSHFIINTQNSGSPFVQWQKGLELAVGDFIWIAESDDSCELDFLETQLNTLNYADVAVAQTKTFNSQGVQKEISHPIFSSGNDCKLTVEALLYCPILNVSAVVFKKMPQEFVANLNYRNYSIIGDRVFYYEAFLGNQFKKNQESTSYFRQEGTGVSNLDFKGIDYLSRYFHEHVQFIELVRKQQEHVNTLSKKYVTRFFHRVRDRLTKKQKMSITYLKLYLYYRYKLFLLG